MLPRCTSTSRRCPLAGASAEAEQAGGGCQASGRQGRSAALNPAERPAKKMADMQIPPHRHRYPDMPPQVARLDLCKGAAPLPFAGRAASPPIAGAQTAAGVAADDPAAAAALQESDFWRHTKILLRKNLMLKRQQYLVPAKLGPVPVPRRPLADPAILSSQKFRWLFVPARLGRSDGVTRGCCVPGAAGDPHRVRASDRDHRATMP